jgi:hypothetical protein
VTKLKPVEMYRQAVDVAAAWYARSWLAFPDDYDVGSRRALAMLQSSAW